MRPIVLFQAQPRRAGEQKITFEVVEGCLKDDFKIPDEQIAIATGSRRDLDGLDLLDRDCPTRYIITQKALKEGWDCAFAYVLCSVADAAPTDALAGFVRDAAMRMVRIKEQEDNP